MVFMSIAIVGFTYDIFPSVDVEQLIWQEERPAGHKGSNGRQTPSILIWLTNCSYDLWK